MSKYGVISGPYFLLFSPNTGKYGPEITPYLDTFHAKPLFQRISQISGRDRQYGKLTVLITALVLKDTSSRISIDPLGQIIYIYSEHLLNFSSNRYIHGWDNYHRYTGSIFTFMVFRLLDYWKMHLQV